MAEMHDGYLRTEANCRQLFAAAAAAGSPGVTLSAASAVGWVPADVLILCGALSRRKLGDALSVALDNLSLGGAAGIRALGQATARGALSRLKLVAPFMDGEGAAVVAAWSEFCPLALGGRQPAEAPAADVVAVADDGPGAPPAPQVPAPSATVLTELDLSRYVFNAAAVAALCAAISLPSCGLLLLRLQAAQLGNDGAQRLAVALKVNRSLTCVDVACNELGDVAAVALADALKVNRCLRSLVLYDGAEASKGDMGEKALSALAEALLVHVAFHMCGTCSWSSGCVITHFSKHSVMHVSFCVSLFRCDLRAGRVGLIAFDS
jgi:hypothetical protein